MKQQDRGVEKMVQTKMIKGLRNILVAVCAVLVLATLIPIESVDYSQNLSTFLFMFTVFAFFGALYIIIQRFFVEDEGEEPKIALSAEKQFSDTRESKVKHSAKSA